MESELNHLEGKITQLIQLCQRLRNDNHELRQKAARLESENSQLSEKITSAKDRLERILSQIPEEE
ncbi:MAG: cell division protein ZapB [Betaproteobacteria bacterium]|nr:cell division protein ZapB [Betaproteobacteria bacterium]